jgi:hypothetical protein
MYVYDVAKILFPLAVGSKKKVPNTLATTWNSFGRAKQLYRRGGVVAQYANMRFERAGTRHILHFVQN